MLKSLDLHHFKGFKRFSIHFRDSAYIVGPNNAGKSTLIQSLRACAHMLRYAMTRSPDGHRKDGTRRMFSYSMSDVQLPLVTENIRHEFISDDSRLVLNFGDGSRLTAVWPHDESETADESGIALVPIGGFSNWDKIEPFVWLVDRLLDRAVQGYVVLDRDYRPEPVTQAIERKLASIGLSVHVWKRKELENYLLVPEAVARISTAPAAWIEKTLEKCSAGLESTVFARELDEALRYELSQTRNRVTVTEAFKVSFDERWRDAQRRIHSCPAKLLLSRLNDELVAAGFRSVSAFGVAKAMTSAEVPEELKSVLHEIEQLATGASQSAAS